MIKGARSSVNQFNNESFALDYKVSCYKRENEL